MYYVQDITHEHWKYDQMCKPMCKILSVYFPIALLKILRNEIDQLIEKYPTIQEEVKEVDETSS